MLRKGFRQPTDFSKQSIRIVVVNVRWGKLPRVFANTAGGTGFLSNTSRGEADNMLPILSRKKATSTDQPRAGPAQLRAALHGSAQTSRQAESSDLPASSRSPQSGRVQYGRRRLLEALVEPDRGGDAYGLIPEHTQRKSYSAAEQCGHYRDPEALALHPPQSPFISHLYHRALHIVIHRINSSTLPCQFPLCPPAEMSPTHHSSDVVFRGRSRRVRGRGMPIAIIGMFASSNLEAVADAFGSTSW